MEVETGTNFYKITFVFIPRANKGSGQKKLFFNGSAFKALPPPPSSRFFFNFLNFFSLKIAGYGF